MKGPYIKPHYNKLFIYKLILVIPYNNTVAVASFWSEAAFVSAISRKSVFSRACEREGLVRVPIDVPTEVLCFPVQMFRQWSKLLDLLASLVFTAVIVGASALVVRAWGLWEVDDDDETH
ncbi:hypothetical protein ACSBR1_000372 [Camellia fascicularis]